MKHLYAEKIFWYHHVVAQNALLLQETSWWSKIEKIAAFFKGKNVSKPDAGDEAFLQFYLASTKDLCIQFLSINVLLLVVSIYIITQEHWGLFHLVRPDPTFTFFSPAVVDIVIWIVLSIMCLGYFLILKYKPLWFNTALLPAEQAVWYELGASILGARLLMLVVQITLMRQENSHCHQCFDGHAMNNPEPTSFGLTFIKLTIDAYQGYVFVILPFPQPWALAFTIIELIRQEIRLLSSAHRIALNPDNRWIVIFVAILIGLTYITILFVPSAYLEGSMQNRFRRVKLRHQAEEIKQEMVVFLSTDVRVPLQYMLHSIASVEFAELTGSSTQPLLKDIDQHTRTVNDVADDLLLLVRIQEKRYTTKMAMVPDLRVLFEGVVQVVLQRRLVERAEGATEGHAMHGTAMPPASAPQRDCFVYTDVPAIEVTVDEKCLVAVLRHLLIFITQEKVNYGSPDSPFATFALDLAVEIINRDGKQALQVMLSGDEATPKDWSEQRRVHEATTAYICNSIASSCGGTFTSKGFSYLLVIPCILAASDVSEIAVGPEQPPSPNSVRGFDDGVRHFDVESASVQTNARSVGTLHPPPNNTRISSLSDRAVLEAKIQASSDMQTRFKRNRVCVIVDDSVMESIITSVITKLRLSDNLSVLHELQKGAYVPVAKLTFVTSYELCAELRRRRYSGLIVLFSGSINYLDDAQVANLDYSLPLPASDAQMMLFVDWLIEKHNGAASKEVARRQDKVLPIRDGERERERERDTLRRRRPSAAGGDGHHHDYPQASAGNKPNPFVLMKLTVLVIAWCASLWKAMFNQDRYFMVCRLPEGSSESYSKWRWLNPSSSWRHHATEQYFTTLTRTIFILFVQLALLKLQSKVLLPTLGVGIVYFIMPYMYKYVLEPCNVKLRHFWQIPNLAILISNLVVIGRAFYGATPHASELTLTEFLHSTFANSSGAECLYSLLMLVAYSRLYFMYQSHPLNIVGMLIFFTRHTQILWLAFNTIMSTQMCQFLQLVFVQMTVLNIIYLTYLEDTYRREFKTAHEHILARAFLDQCLDICQHDIRKPLEFLLQRQKDLMQVAVHAGYIRAFKITRNYLGRLEPLHVAGALLSEMAQELTFIRHNILTVTAATAVTPPVDHMKSHYSMNSMQLHRAVAGLISSLSSTAESSNVKIYAEVDNKLAVIRVDWKNLSMILTNLVSTALRNIRDFCIETPRNKDLVSYIKIKMVAIDSDAKVPFVHPRVMLINVCDSSNAAAKAAAFSANSRRPSGGRSDPSGNYRRNSDSGSVSEITEQRDRLASQYGRSTCEQLVRKLTPAPVFQTIAVQSVLQTVQRFTFQYHLTPQTRRSQDYIQAETDLPYLTVLTSVAHYFDAYKRIIYPPKVYDKTTGEAAPNKEVIYFTSILVAQRNDVMKLIAQFQWMFWNCTVKYILNIPSMHSVSGADCVLIDYQLEAQEGVNICDTVLKLRVCGFNGVVAVVLQEGLRDCDLIRDELTKSAADVDLIFTGPIRDQNIQAMTVALEKKTVKHLLYMNGN